jgi:hypothetical protein
MAVYIKSPLKCIFVHNPKTGGTSIQKWLIDNTDSNVIKGVKHARLEIVSKRVPEYNWSFSVVRNPWDWVVSWYFFKHDRAVRRIETLKYKSPAPNKQKKKYNIEYNQKILEEHEKGFDFFVDKINSNPQIHKIQNVDYVMRLENLDNDFKLVQEKLGCFEPLPFINASKRNKDYRNYYNSKTKDIIYEKFKDDIKSFDYEF